MKTRFLVLVSMLLCSLLLHGCVDKIFNVGKSEGYCEENGCDYSDAGVCADPYWIYHNKKEANKQSYTHIECDCGKGDLN